MDKKYIENIIIDFEMVFDIYSLVFCIARQEFSNFGPVKIINQDYD